MKKILNTPETLVHEMCSGIALAHTEMEFIKKYKVLKKRDINPNKVTLISGGGSGHEPAHAGFIGKGMLDAAVCGDVFASPSQIQVYKAICQTKSEKGTLLIIKNYSGDIMNFKNAAHLATEDGILVDYIKVDDDIAVEDSLYTVGRRGVAGTVLVHKIAGAAAEAGLSLPEVKVIAQKAADSVRSIGFAFTSCTVPAKGTPTFSLAEDEMEYGVGIHGEPGIRREKIADANALANRMSEALVNELKIKDEPVAILVNGFGATPVQELYALNYSVMANLSKLGVKVARIFVGNYMTSIDMAGASLSIMKLDDQLLNYLDAVSVTPAFRVDGPVQAPVFEALDTVKADKSEYTVEQKPIVDEKLSLDNLKFIVNYMGEVLIENEVPFCELDAHAGDGDFGMSVAKGFKQLQKEWVEIVEHSKTISEFLSACSLVIMEYCGGASGPIWGSAFRGAAKATEGKEFLTVADFANMLDTATKFIQSTGERSFGRGAVVGDKTLIDALVPCVEAWLECAKNNDTFETAFASGAKGAVDGALKTVEIAARMGRAGTVGDRSIGYPDAGAHALGVVFTEISKKLF